MWEKMESKYYSYGIEINLLNVIIDHKFQIPNSFIFSDHQTGVCFSSILFHIGNDNIFSVRFSFEINYNFFLCCFPYGFGAREKENIKNLAPPVIFFFFSSSHTQFHSFFSSVSEFFWKKAQLLLITAIISSLLFTLEEKPPVRELFLPLLLAHMYSAQVEMKATFSLQYFNLSQKIVVLRYLHCCFLREIH